MHIIMEDGPNTMLNERGTAADRKTEREILFGSGPVEPNIRMDLRKDTPLSHPAAAHFRRSFRNSFAKPPYSFFKALF